MVNKIIDFLEEKKCSIEQLKKIWRIIYEDWEDYPNDENEAIGFITDSIVDCGSKAIQKVYRILFEEDDDL